MSSNLTVDGVKNAISTMNKMNIVSDRDVSDFDPEMHTTVEHFGQQVMITIATDDEAIIGALLKTLRENGYVSPSEEEVREFSHEEGAYRIILQ